MPEKRSKTIWIVLGIILLIIIGAVFAFVSLTGSSVTPAIVYPEGDVQVNSGKGFVPATVGMEVFKRAQIKTSSGVAILALYEGETVHIGPNSIVTIASLGDKIILEQDSGSTWTRFNHVSDTQSIFIKTPNSVVKATGTAFFVKAGVQDEIFSSEGELEVTNGKTQRKVKPFKKIKIDKNGIHKAKLTDKNLWEIKDTTLQDIETLKKLRLREANKHKFLLEQAKKRYAVTDAQIEAALEKIDNGEIDIEKYEAQIPIKIKSIQKIIKITKKIQELNAQVSDFDQM